MNGMRDKLKAGLNSDRPAELAALVGESEPYGRELDRWRQVRTKALPLPCVSTVFLSKTVPFHAVLHNTQAVVDRKAAVIHVAQDALDSCRRGEDYLATVACLEKYKDFSPEVEPSWEGLQKRSEELLDAAQETLRRLVAAPDPADILAAMKKYEGCDTPLPSFARGFH
eukprot:SAG22_NODE_1670_length_3847_cov_30.303895_6_plen_169_part_00